MGDNEMGPFWALIIMQGLFFGGFCAFVAGQKGRDNLNWFVLGFLFSVIALIALIAVPEVNKPSEPQAKLKPCPFCAESIQAAALKCRYCNSDLSTRLQTEGRSSASGRPINDYDHEGRTPLMNAVQKGDLAEVISLLGQGADGSIKDNRFGTASALDMANLALRRAGSPDELATRQEIVNAITKATSEHAMT
jgi:hypothetical protein